MPKQVSVELLKDFLNAFNHPNFGFTSSNFDSSSFAQITGTRGSARVINFILTLNF